MARQMDFRMSLEVRVAMPVKEVIRLARLHYYRTQSEAARTALAEAMRLYQSGMSTYAKHKALDSLRASVGRLHPDYKAASEGEAGY